jgi:hypothetical protein
MTVAVAGLVGIECGVVSGVINLESSGVDASDWRPRHDEHRSDNDNISFALTWLPSLRN